MKKILITTIGEQEKPLYEGMKVISKIDKVYLLASDFTDNIAEKIKQNISNLYQADVIKINEKELDSIIDTLIEIHRKEKNSEFVYNLTGGTKIMSLACHVVASFLGERMLYIFKRGDNSMEIIEVPVLKYNLNKIIARDDKRHKILKLLKEKPRTITELAKILKLEKATVSAGHIKKLKEQNLVEIKEISRNKQSIVLSNTGKIFLSLLEVVE